MNTPQSNGSPEQPLAARGLPFAATIEATYFSCNGATAGATGIGSNGRLPLFFSKMLGSKLVTIEGSASTGVSDCFF